jgi:TatD DNase family protein
MDISEQNFYIDIHTHSSGNAEDVIQIINLFPEQPIVRLAAHSFYSIGWHPWFLKEALFDAYLKVVAQKSSKPEILAIGECGLDHLSEVSFGLQLKVFREQALIAEKIQKPLLIHCVRASNELIKFKKEIKPQMPWIIHGFNSNLITGRELIRHGFYISIGVDLLKGNSNAINFIPEIPIERLFLETGDVDIHIEKIYHSAASILNKEVNTLKDQIYTNFNQLFPNYSVRNK